MSFYSKRNRVLGLSKYTPDQWGLFIESSKLGLECVLIHNLDQYEYEKGL